MLQAVIFDFDGVIADTEKLHLRAFQEVLGERGIALTAGDYYEQYLGLDDAGVLRALARDCGLTEGDAALSELLKQKMSRYRQLIADSPVLFDGVEERLHAWAKSVPMAIASGALRAEIQVILGRYRLLDVFTAIVTAEDVTRGKPAPDPYLLALERLNGGRIARRPKPGGQRGNSTSDIAPSDIGRRTIQAHDVVVIEDSRPGVESAQAAGMRVVAVTTNCPASQFARAELVVGSMAHLDLQTLRRLCVQPPIQ